MEIKSENIENYFLNMRRCKKCVLPETFPGIEFDENNECNYCKNYEPMNPKGEEAFLRFLSNYEGKAVVLYFFYRSCTYCKFMGPALDELTEGYSSDNIVVFALTISSIDKNTDIMNDWKEDKGCVKCKSN